MLIPFGVFSAAGAGGSGGGTPAYELISTGSGNGSSNTISFSSIPTSTYKHLQIRYTLRTSWSATQRNFIYTRFNSDSAANYATHELYGDGSSVTSTASSDVSQIYLPPILAASATSGAFTVGVIDILDAFSTSKFKTIRISSGYHTSAGSGIQFLSSRKSGLWRSTSAIDAITIASLTAGDNFITGSRISLYGIRG